MSTAQLATPQPFAGLPGVGVAISLLSAQFMTTLDTSIVNVALPGMQHGLGFTASGVEWVVTAYLLFLGGFLLFSGRVGDVVDPRRLLQGGLGLFAISSLAGGVAWTPLVLILARALQGLGAAVITPTALTLITTLFSAAPVRRRILSWWSATGSFGFACGALLGGVLVQWLSWRAVMLVNVPLCVVAYAGTLLMPAVGRKSDARGWRVIDFPGAIVVTTSMLAWVFALSWVPAHGWAASGTVISAGVGAGLGAVFVFRQRHIRCPLIPPELVRIRGIVVANVIMLIFGITATSGVWLLLTLFMQHMLHYSPFLTGLAFLPLALVAAAAAPMVSRLHRRCSTRWLLVGGLVIVTVGLALLARLHVRVSYATGLLPGMLCVGFGFVLVLLTTVDTATTSAPRQQRGVASGLINTTAQLAGAFGVAIYITLAHPTFASSTTAAVDCALPFTLAALLLGLTALGAAWGFPTSVDHVLSPGAFPGPPPPGQKISGGR